MVGLMSLVDPSADSPNILSQIVFFSLSVFSVFQSALMAQGGIIVPVW